MYIVIELCQKNHLRLAPSIPECASLVESCTQLTVQNVFMQYFFFKKIVSFLTAHA